MLSLLQVLGCEVDLVVRGRRSAWGHANVTHSRRAAPPLRGSRMLQFDEGGRTMQLKLTAVFEQVPEGYIGYVEELPGANTQGATLDEARESLAEALELVLDANRVLAEERLGDRDVIREPLRISA